MRARKRPPVRMGECALCHDPIVWITLDTGSRMPLDPLPLDELDPRGNVAARVIGGRLHGWVISREHPLDPLMLKMRPHAATCPVIRDRQQHRDQHPSLF